MSKSKHRENYAIFASVLRKARKDADLRQIDVAKKLGRPQSFVAKYEGCERRLDVIEFMEVARAIGIGWDTILADVACEIWKD